MAGDKVIVISTHILEEVEALCSRAIVIGNGKILCDKSPEDLQALSIYHHAVSLVLDAPALERLAPAIHALAGVRKVERQEIAPGLIKLCALPEAGAALLGPLHRIIDGQEGVREFYQERGRLDDVFRTLTTDPDAEQPQEGSPL
jgi:ABC-2 type transport system ATP-binding protein